MAPGQVAKIVLDLVVYDSRRMDDIAFLGRSGSRQAADALLELAGRDQERPEILQAAGAALRALHEAGVVISEFELRDLQRAAADAFFEEG